MKKEQIPLWEPAKPGETLEDVWIPNRKERRKLLKGKKREQKLFGKMLQQTEKAVKSNPDKRQEIYKALYENLRQMTENIEEELQKKNEEEGEQNNGTVEGNEGLSD